MARFIAEIQGARGPASRLGNASSGVRGHIRGWTLGGRVECLASGESDVVLLEVTGGSNAEYHATQVAALRQVGPMQLMAVYVPGEEDARRFIRSPVAPSWAPIDADEWSRIVQGVAR